MNRLTIVFLTVASLLLAPSAFAKDMSGRFGLGYDTTMGGVNGLSIRYQTGKSFGIQGVLGFDFSNTGDGTADLDGNAADRTDILFKLALRGDLNIAYTSDVNLSIPFGLNILIASTNATWDDPEDDSPDDPEDDSPDLVDVDAGTQINLEAGLKIEWFVTDFFSVNLEWGVVLYIIGDDGYQGAFAGDVGSGGELGASSGGEGAMELDFLTAGDVFGAAGVTFWF